QRKASLPFVDVTQGDYYYDAVAWALANGITEGHDPTHFGPADICKRSQAVTFLWRAKGCPKPALTKENFVDVAPDDWWYEPVLWALENGITEGNDPTHFDPDQTCSFAHILTFLWRTMGRPGDTGSEATAEWYADAMRWAESEGMLVRSVLPAEDCPRADVVYSIYQYRN
ncbi:MAG: S-layer homology domain-containing protein, partial [Lachnospiraceae bacterium]|nr:S-layer homology domain-containing protein [Lachnospiraceae bacterium]